MEEKKKIPFFIRLKNAVINFDEYQNFANEKISVAIKYVIKLVIIFSIIITIAITYKFYEITNKVLVNFKESFPEFKFENNLLVVESNKKFNLEDENYSFGIIVDTEKEEIDNIQYERSIIFLKDKIVLKSSNTFQEITYEQLGTKYNLNLVSKQGIIDYTSSNRILTVYAIFTLVTLIYTFISYFVITIMDIVFLSVLGYLISKIFKINFKYVSIFNISVYSITLSFLLYIIYTTINVLTGYTIKYFNVAYDLISYIYLITAILMIKSDAIKRQIEVKKIVEEQKKVFKEDKPKDEEKDKEENKPKNKKKKKSSGEEGAPEGSKA